MINEQLIKALRLLDEKSLETLRTMDKETLNKLLYHIEQEFLPMFNQDRQNNFEKYLMSHKKNVLCDNQDKIIFSNGISLYYLNRNYVSLNSPVLINQNIYQTVNIEAITKLETMIKDNSKQLIDVEWFYEDTKDTLVEGNGAQKLNSGIITSKFSTKELGYTKKILDNPTYKMDTEYPILVAESEVGKAYVLGYKK